MQKDEVKKAWKKITNFKMATTNLGIMNLFIIMIYMYIICICLYLCKSKEVPGNRRLNNFFTSFMSH